jgi:hypothetical protein
MFIDLPDTLPMHTLATALRACGVELDPKVYHDGVYRVRPASGVEPTQCNVPYCGRGASIVLDRVPYCAHHALESSGRDAGV